LAGRLEVFLFEPAAYYYCCAKVWACDGAKTLAFILGLFSINNDSTEFQFINYIIFENYK